MTAVKRASTPRKTAARPPDPPRNGDGQIPARPPERVAGLDDSPEVSHPYGDAEVFVWRPRNKSEPIVLPHINTAKTTQEFFCKIYDLNEMFQSFEWMILAGVPKDIRVAVAKLGDDDPADQARLFRSWFAPITRPTGGEPPGES
jgi:hypothetical protein